MRRAIAAAMARSNREIPHYYLSTQIDMSTAIGWLEQTNRQRSIEKRLLPAALLLKGVARALVEVPELNGYWVEDQLKPSAEIHLESRCRCAQVDSWSRPSTRRTRDPWMS